MGLLLLCVTGSPDLSYGLYDYRSCICLAAGLFYQGYSPFLSWQQTTRYLFSFLEPHFESTETKLVSMNTQNKTVLANEIQWAIGHRKKILLVT